MTEHTTSYYAASAKYEPFPTLEDPSTVTSASSAAATPASRLPCIWPKWATTWCWKGARIGFGASGRNGGQLVNSYSRDIDVIEKNYGRMRQNARQHDVRRRRYHPRTHPAVSDPVRLRRPGGLFVAMNHKQLETPEEQKANWERYGNTQLELLTERPFVAKWTATATSAPCSTTAAYIHPLNLAIGEADAIRLNGGQDCMSSRRSPASSTPARRWSAPRGQSPRAT